MLNTDSVQHTDGMSQAPWNIFVRGGALGDFILSLPLLARISASQRPLCLITRRTYMELVGAKCRCDRFVDLDGAEGACLYGGAASPQLTCILRGAQVFVFSKQDQEMSDHLQTLDVKQIRWIDPRPDVPPHAAVRFLREGGFDPPPGLLQQPFWTGEGTGDALWLHPGSGSREKNWPPALFASIADAWRRETDGPVIVSFGPADAALANPMRQELVARGVHAEELHCPRLGLLKALLTTRARIFVGNDSGISHLAGACGVRTVAFFRNTSPVIWRPLGNCAVVPDELDQMQETWLTRAFRRAEQS